MIRRRAWFFRWLVLPNVHSAGPGDNHLAALADVLRRLACAGNLTTETHLATLAIERGYILCSTGADIAHFPGLEWENPCA